MRPAENFRPYIASAFALSLAILITFQIYIKREPSRIQRDEAADRISAESNGAELFAKNCASCHGSDGQGGVGPPLNDRKLLETTVDEVLFSLTRTGIPGTIMPAWGQSTGGPFTDVQISQIVAFIRSWEPDAPIIESEIQEPDSARGAVIYDQTCFVCHGKNGEGTDLAPAVNDLERLQKLDDAWYRNTIAHGRPAKGMPTWGTVLSPSQINDVVALFASWREGKVVQAEIPLATFVSNALFSVREFDHQDAVFYLQAAKSIADKDLTKEIQAIIDLVNDNQLYAAEMNLISLLPPEEMGRAAFASNCAPCHGEDGSGGLGPNLIGNSFIQELGDGELYDFILQGRSGTAMDGFEGILGDEQINNLILLMRGWQE